MKHRNFRRNRRRGTSTVELAFCFPVLFALILGGIEACNVISLRQTLTVAAYEGMLQATAPDAQQTPTLNRVQAMLAARSVTAQAVEIQDIHGNPVLLGSLSHGDAFRISVTAAIATNVPPPRLFNLLPTISVFVAGHKQ